MGNIICPLVSGLEQDERFKELEKRYPHFTPEDLSYKLQCYREFEDKDIDWYPVEDEDYKSFTDYLSRPVSAPKITVTKESLNELYHTITTLYTPAKLENRLNRISVFFESYVDDLVKKSPFGVSRQRVITAQAKSGQSGFTVIMEKVFSYIKELSTLDGEIAWYKNSNPNATEEQIEANKEWLQHRADEFSVMYDNKESLAMLASLKVGAKEGFAINIDGLSFRFTELDEVKDIVDDINSEKELDTEEAQKGDRYVDSRTFSLSVTLSLEARKLLEKVYTLDRDGNVVRDDLGYPVPVDMKQAIISLHKVLQASTPQTMEEDLNKAVSRYPWMRSLINRLALNPDERTLVYCNFKKARNIYYYGYKNRSKGGQIDVRNINNVADGKSLSREAGVNLSSSSMADEKYSIINNDGTLKGKDAISEIRGVVDALKKLPLRAKEQSVQKQKWTTEDSAKDWREQVNSLPVSEFESFSNILRGLGFALDADDVQYALANSAPIGKITGKRKDGVTPMDSALDRVIWSVNEIIKRADYIIDQNDDVTGSHLFSYAQDEFSKLADILAAAQKNEVEERSISMSKSLASATTPNALHEISDFLSNVAGLSDAEYRKQVMERFGQFEGMSLGFGDSIKLVGWLNDFVNNGNDGSGAEYKILRRSFKVVDFTDLNNITQKEFATMTTAEHAIMSYVMYSRGLDNRTSEYSGHMYEVPIQADYETAYNFIIAPSYSYTDLVERFAQEIECEAQRIAAIRERTQKDNPASPNRALVGSVYEDRGAHFQIFPELDTNGFRERYSSAVDPVSAHQVALDEADIQLKKLLESERNKLREFGFFKKENMKLSGIAGEDDKSVNEWLLNSTYAREQITKLMYGGIEHFKSTTDFEKRNMYSHATRLPLYTEATYRGEHVGKSNQKAVYFEDDESRSSAYDHIVKVADRLVSQKKLTQGQANAMKRAYESIKTTDGQGLRTLPSMRAVKIMASIWTDEDEVAYQHIMSGNYRPSDVNHFFVGMKPVYTGYEIIPAQEGQYQKPVRVPVLHKYSEMILLPEMLEDIDAQTSTTPFRAMNKINKKLGKGNEIDLFIFGSGVKIGAHSVLAPFAKDKKTDDRLLHSSDEIADFVVENIKNGSFYIHNLPLKYYGVTASMHADVEDEYIAWASQAEKEAWGNILDNESITVAGKPMEAKKARDLFYKIKAARTIDSYKRLAQRFADPLEIARILKEELANKTYQSRELLFALQMRDSGTFAFPLYSPNLQHDVTALLSSIIRKTFTRVPTRGANMTQTTSLGFDKEYEGRAFDSEAIDGFDELELKFDEDSNFLYSEAYLPIEDSGFEQFADENGQITPKRLETLIKQGFIPESALNFIAYRTPSDAEHSIIPCRIKGFLSKNAGPSIRLPREIMKMTGHDYDGDKMRCHFKQLYVGWNDKKMKADFEKFADTEVVQNILSSDKDVTTTPYEIFRRNIVSGQNPRSDEYRALKEVKYNWSSNSPFDSLGKNGDYGALNNALIDLMYGQLTSINGGMKMFIPGGNEETVRYANTIGTRSKQESVVTPFATTHATESHDYMMDGAGMIGVYALYNSAGMMMQRINLEYKMQNNSHGDPINVSFFGKSIGNLYPILSNDTFNSLGMSRLLNAAVDNGKDPLLGYLNQTMDLAHLTNFLSAAGLEEKDIHLIFNQPVMKELARRLKASGDDVTVPQAISSILFDMQKGRNFEKKELTQENSVRRVANISRTTMGEYLDKSFGDILLAKDADWQNQYALLQTIQHINPAARDLEQFIKLTRPESDAGGIDSTLGGIISKLIQLDNFRVRMSTSSEDPVRISGVNDVLEYRDIYANSMTREMILTEVGTELPEVVALNSLMKDSILRLLRPYFPQTRESWLRVAQNIANQYSYDRIPGSVMERITNDMILYKLLQNPSFITGNPQDEQTRVIEDVPENLRSLKKRIAQAQKNASSDPAAAELIDNIFINNLDLGATIGGEGKQISRIRFKMNGAHLEDTADNIRSAWSQLLYSSDASIRQLATDLFKYNLYTNGFSFGRYEFAHYAPVDVILQTPGYIKALNDILTDDWTEEDEQMFSYQYVMNHWGDKNLLERYTPDQLPVNLRTQLGFTLRVRNEVKPEAFSGALSRSNFIIVRKVVNGKPQDELYMLNKSNTGFVESLTLVSKMGIRNKNKQVIVQYNPRVRSVDELKPRFTSNNVVWEGRGSTEDDVADSGISEAERMAAIDEIEYQFPIPTPDTFKKLKEETGKNNGVLTAEQASALGFEDEMLYLVNVDENGNISGGYYEATPFVVNQARKQQAFHDLYNSLQKILQDAGVRVGVLEDSLARIGAGGVTDFTQVPEVLTQGLIELVRLSNDQSIAEYALPEEFAHIALEMLGATRAIYDENGNLTEIMHENKLVERLLNYLNKNDKALQDAYAGQYDKYAANSLYQDKEGNPDREKLIKEASGKLVAKALFENQYASTPDTRSLVRRICDTIKAFFRNPVWSIKRLYDSIFGAARISSQLAKELLSGKLADEMKLEKITTREKFLQLNNDISNKSDIVSKMMKYTAKRLDILNSRLKYSIGKGASSASIDVTRKQLDKLKASLNNQKTELTVIDYLKDTMDFMRETEKSLDEAINNRPANAVCKKLRIVKDTLFSFSSIVKDVRDAISSGELQDDVNLNAAISEVANKVEQFWAKYDNISQMYFKEFLSSVYGKDGITVTIGKDKGKHISIDDMSEKAEKDIDMASRLLHAISDCGDYVLQAMDRVTRDAKQNARERVRLLRPQLESAFANLVREQGNRDQSWIFEKIDGKRTGRYISEKEAEALSPARKEFYRVFMELKKEADSCLPETLVSARKMIMFRKQHYEKMREAEGLNGKAKEEWENAKRSVLEMEDVDFENEIVNKDFEDNIVDLLPVKFINKTKKESYDDMTEDAATSLMAYLGMAEEYREMNNVIGILENARYASSKRDVQKKRGLKDMIISVGSEKDIHYREPYTVKQSKTNIQAAMNDFFQMHVYGHLDKNEGTFGKTRISKRKVTRALAGYTSIGQMAFNIHQRIANVNTGGTMILVESAGGEISAKDVTKAAGIWVKESGDRLAESGKTDYNNKLSLWMDKFDVHQDNGRENLTTVYGKTDFSRVFNTHLPYAGLSVGEDFLAGTTAIAFALNYEMIGPNGEKSNLWDAYEVRFLKGTKKDKDGKYIDGDGAYLALKDGYKKADGTELTFADEKAFQRKIIGTNFELQGIYNVDDRSAIQQYSLGSLAIMYRKWIAPAIKRRYAGVKYSNLKNDYTEGFYRTAVRFAKGVTDDWLAPKSEEEAQKNLLRMLTDFNAMKDAIVLNWSKMTDYEKGNCKKAFREMAIMFGLVLCSGLLKNLPPEDHDGNQFLCWADQMAMSQLFRLRSEIGSQAPTPQLVSEALRIGSSPFPAMRPIVDTIKGINLLWIPNYFEEVESGRYKGHKKAYKYFRRLPIIGFFNKLDNAVNPSTMLNYYKNQNYK